MVLVQETQSLTSLQIFTIPVRPSTIKDDSKKMKNKEDIDDANV